MATLPFELSHDMFGLYVPEKWSSNVHNLPRMRSKDALVRLAQAVQDEQADNLQGLSRASSDEVPNITNQKRVESQWVYWARDAKERQGLASFLEKMPLGDASIFTVAAHEKHASIALVMRQDGLSFGLHVPPAASVDRRNVSSKLEQMWQRTLARDVFQALPAGTVMQWGAQEPVPASHIDDEALKTLAANIASQPHALFVGLRFAHQAIETTRDSMVETLRQAMAPLVKLYRFAAWHRDNDAIEASKQLAQERADKKRTLAPFAQKAPVRIIGGMFRGQRGTVVECKDPRGQVKVLLGRMSVLIAREDLVEA